MPAANLQQSVWRLRMTGNKAHQGSIRLAVVPRVVPVSITLFPVANQLTLHIKPLS